MIYETIDDVEMQKIDRQSLRVYGAFYNSGKTIHEVSKETLLNTKTVKEHVKNFFLYGIIGVTAISGLREGEFEHKYSTDANFVK